MVLVLWGAGFRSSGLCVFKTVQGLRLLGDWVWAGRPKNIVGIYFTYQGPDSLVYSYYILGVSLPKTLARKP